MSSNTSTRTVPGSTARTIRRIDAKIDSLIAEKRAAIAQIMGDFEWMDIPTVTVKECYIDARSQDADTLHVLRQTDERDGWVTIRCHVPGDCPVDGYWCRHGEPRRTRHNHGRGFQYSFAGTYRVFARLDGEVYLAATRDHERD